MNPAQWSSEVKKGFFIGIGLSLSLIVFGMATGVLRTAVR